MNFLKEIFNNDNDKNNILEENRQLKVKKKHIFKELEKIRLEKEEISSKYIELLEEKSNGFDKYIYYHDLYADAHLMNKAQKKEINELKNEIKRLSEELEKSKSKRGGKNVKTEK